MKKILKRVSIVFIAVICITVTVFTVSADTYFEYYGYKYSIYNDTSISIAGWDNRTPELYVPNRIEKRDVVSIADQAFRDNTEITLVSFANVKRLRRIGMYAFENCTAITSDIYMPDCVNTLGSGTFFNCASVPSIRFSKYVTTIPEECCYNCYSLNSVILPETLEKIDRIAFANCTSLKYVEIPKSVTFIDTTAFYNDTSLVLGVYKDTIGHQFAVENSVPHIVLDGPKAGDANGDGMVDILDSTEIQKFAAEMIELSDEQFELADINNDGFVDVIDALLVQKYVVGKFDIPPIIYYT